jgi:hypothetical protein
MFNDVWSDSFIRTGAKTTTVEIQLDNDIVITRTKGADTNTINITYPDKTIKFFEKFGIQAPVEVKQVLGIFPLKLDSDYLEDINIHMQDDPHFLLSESSSTKTKFINRMTNLHILDATNRALSKDTNESKQQLQESLNNKESLVKKISEYDYVQKKKERLQILLEKQESLFNDLTSYQRQLEIVLTLAQKKAWLIKTKKIHDRRANIITKLTGLKGLYTGYKNYTKQENLINKKNFYLAKSEKIKNLITMYKSIAQESDNLNKVNHLIQLQLLIDDKRAVVANTKIEIKDLVEQLGVCPTCNRPFGGTHVD